MKTMGGSSLIDPDIPHTNEEALKGSKLFQCINSFIYLTENMRAHSQLASFLTKARTGDINSQDLALINTRVVNTIDQAMRKSHPSALYVTSTHAKIKDINEKFQKKMRSEGGRVYRLIARHTPKNVGIPVPNTALRRELYGVTGHLSFY